MIALLAMTHLERLALTQAEEPDDSALVGRVLAGDKSAYRLLTLRYQGRLFAVAFGLVHDAEDARDITQEAFTRAYRNLAEFRRDSSFYTWLYRIAANLGIDQQRRQARKMKREMELDETLLTPEQAHHTGPRPMATPGQNLERKQLGLRIRAAIDMLPPEQRHVIVLRELQGLSYKEIAETVGCAEGTVMSRLYYGRRKLQQILRDLGG